MSADQLRKFREIFNLYDENNDNKISTSELDTVMYALGVSLTRKEMNQVMHELDTNRNGYIDFDEFVVLMLKKEQEGYTENEIQTAFKMFDRDNNGYVDKEEFKLAMTSLGDALSDAEVEDMMKLADKNGDGKIQYDEFVAMMFS